MSNVRNSLVMVLMVLGLSNSNVYAQESESLQNAHLNVIQACPIRWEKMPEYLAHTNDHVVSRITYTEAMKIAGVDIWQGDAADRQNYIKFALRNLVDSSGNPLESFTHPLSVTYQCWRMRNEYLLAKETELNLATSSFINRFDEFRDDDNDGFFNHVDVCPTTDHQGVTAGTGNFEIFDDNGDYVVDADLSSDTTGCASWERDADLDGISDHYDYCRFTAGAASTSDGCGDADGDGLSDLIDPYPYQNNTMCVP